MAQALDFLAADAEVEELIADHARKEAEREAKKNSSSSSSGAGGGGTNATPGAPRWQTVIAWGS